MLGGGFKTELWWFFGVLCLCGILGVIFLSPPKLIAIGAVVYSLRLFYLIHRLEKWSGQASRLNFPPQYELPPILSEITYNIENIFSRHKKQKQRLVRVIERVQKMGSALSDGVVLLDKNENIEWWNGAAELIFQLKRQDFGHKLINIIRHPKFIQYFEAKDYKKPLELDMWQKQQHLEIQLHPYGKGEYLLVARDITRLYRLELMRKDFVANVSHELRTPLTVIRGYVETFADCDMPATWTKAFKQMEQQCLRMDTLISDLIALSKLETGQKDTHVPIQVSRLLQSLVGDLKPLSEDKNVIVRGDTDRELMGCEPELRSALSNLIVNAINYSNTKKDIIVECEQTDSAFVIKVIDRGIGIDPKHIPRLTERFYRVDTSRTVATGGTGLGLAIVKHVLLRHNAELIITSKLGEGSTFACHFPLKAIHDPIGVSALTDKQRLVNRH